MAEDKYVVFKKVQFDRGIKSLEGDYHHGTFALLKAIGDPVPDATVIRRQDIFAAPGLTAYADSIQTTIAVIENNIATPEAERKVLLDKLQGLADFFHEEARKAWTTPYRKIPD